MPIVPKTVLVVRAGFADGVLINASDFDEHTDVLWTAAESKPEESTDLAAAEKLLAELKAATPPASAAQIAEAEALVAGLTPAG